MAVPILPIHRLNLNQCPNCEGTMVLVEKTISFINVDKNGIPDNNVLSDDEINIKYVCTQCSRVYDVDKQGMHYMIKRTTRPLHKEEIKEFNPFYA